ncbi:MAG: hypothetical protein Q9217_004162 [Psora testacea]
MLLSKYECTASETLSTTTSTVPAINGQIIAVPTSRLRFADVGINLTDSTFRGVYHGRRVHEEDTKCVLERAVAVGCVKFMVTGSDLEESRNAIVLAEEHPGLCYATVGVHPCSANTFESHPGGPSKLLEDLENLAIDAKKRGVGTAFGEIGLDYDRLYLTEKDQQLKYFEAQLDLAVKVQLPLFLHSRAAGADFERLLKPRVPLLPKRGLVHSFTGTMEEMQNLVDLGLDIGVNGCSMKTDDNLEVVKAIPLDRLQIETDGPWCEMRSSHASAKYKAAAPALPKAVKKERWEKDCMIKGRNEPASISHVAHVIAKVKNIPIEKVCNSAWTNSIQIFYEEEELGTLTSISRYLIVMGPEEREQIVREHGPHITKILNTAKTKHIAELKKFPARVHFKGAPNIEDSGPPSPRSGTIPNFGEIAPKVYRSSFPYASNLGHLKGLGLKTLITLVKTKFDVQVTQYLKEANIKHYRILIPAHKNGNTIAMEDVAQVIRIITNPLNHPVLIHCNKGKHRTGCMTACLRKLANHQSLTQLMHPQYLSEYQDYARGKNRSLDEAFIRDFSPKELLAAIDAIETAKTAVSPIDYYSTDLPSPPTSKSSSESSPVYSRDLSPVETIDDEVHGPMCHCVEDGNCPFQLEHERVAMAEFLGPVSKMGLIPI